MSITRNTIRADGITVGEAMDRDAAFLRSIGIDAKDGTLPYDEAKDQYREHVRVSVIAALDTTVPDGKGWIDSDLPLLFRALDAHAERVFDRKFGAVTKAKGGA